MKKTKIDWVRFRTQSPFVDVFRAIKKAFYGSGEILELGPEIKGMDGWHSRRNIYFSDLHFASIDYGGEHQRGWVRFDMSALGCEWIEDWAEFAKLGEVLKVCQLRRVDVCLDTFDGSMSHEKVLEAYENGQFKLAKGGRNPKLKKIETTCKSDGRTIYIGNRASSPRYIRCYEKGWEILAKLKMPETFLKPGLEVNFPNGGYTKPEDYYRVEVEFKAIDDLLIRWDILSDPDSYFAGSSPFCESLVAVSPKRAQMPPSDKIPKAVLASQMEHARLAYGGLFRALLEVYGSDQETKARLFDELSGNKPSDRLIREGVLTVNH